MMRYLDDAGVRRDLAAYWEVHQRVAEEVRARVIGELRDYLPSEVLALATSDPERSERLQQLVKRAVENGEWEPYLRELREQGQAFERRGLRFADWFLVVRAFRPHVVPHLVDAYGDGPSELASAIRGMGIFFDTMIQVIGEAYLDAREHTIAKQRGAISELSTPVLQIRPGLLLLPIVGVVDTERSRHLTEELLHSIRANRARVVVMDITGVPEVDSSVANRLVQAAEAARLMGATPILTGISAGVAQTLVTLGVDLKGLRTVGDLQGGIEQADEVLGIRIVWEKPLPDRRR